MGARRRVLHRPTLFGQCLSLDFFRQSLFAATSGDKLARMFPAIMLNDAAGKILEIYDSKKNYDLLYGIYAMQSGGDPEIIYKQHLKRPRIIIADDTQAHG
jgi:hypothetical protein